MNLDSEALKGKIVVNDAKDAKLVVKLLENKETFEAIPTRPISFL